ncbi:MAG: hypothetical protein WCP29_06450 [Acidobacteriota bacterium]
MRNESRANRIQDNVSADGRQIPVLLDHLRFESPLEHVTAPAVPAIPPLRVDAVEVLESRRQVCPGRDDDEMIVIRHQAERVAIDAEPASGDREQLKKPLIVSLVEEGQRFGVAPRHDVVARVWELDAEWSGHTGRGRQQSFRPTRPRRAIFAPKYQCAFRVLKKLQIFDHRNVAVFEITRGMKHSARGGPIHSFGKCCVLDLTPLVN